MRTLEAIAISNTIIDNVNAVADDLQEEMTKNGYVSVDGRIRQYNPRTYTFVDVSENDLNTYINSILPNRWNVLSIKQILDSAEKGLPQLSERQVNNFNAYMTSYLKEIDTNLTETALQDVFKEYEQYNNLEVAIKDGHDITNQLIVMKQNKIFSDLKTMYLYKFKDGQFQIYNLNDVLGLFRSHLANEDVKMQTSDVQRNRITYLTSLTNIHNIRVALKDKQNKESTLKNCESDYKEVLKILKQY